MSEKRSEPANPTKDDLVYQLCYQLAFGATYVGCVAMGLLPPDSMIRHGLQDGADAARRAHRSRGAEDEAAAAEMAVPEEVEMETEAG